jgi:hypothetical protein
MKWKILIGCPTILKLKYVFICGLCAAATQGRQPGQPTAVPARGL